MKRILLCGNSLVMSAIGASLEDSPELEVLSIDPSRWDSQQMGEIHPDAVIFDLAAVQPEFSVELWKVQPDLLVIGVDLMTGKSMVLSRQPARVLTTDDLVQLLRNKPAQAGSDAD